MDLGNPPCQYAICFYDYNAGVDVVLKDVQPCIVAHIVHPAVVDEEILGFLQPIAAHLDHAGVCGRLHIIIIGHGELADGDNARY